MSVETELIKFYHTMAVVLMIQPSNKNLVGIAHTCEKYIIIRFSWVFARKSNFVPVVISQFSTSW